MSKLTVSMALGLGALLFWSNGVIAEHPNKGEIHKGKMEKHHGKKNLNESEILRDQGQNKIK